MFLPLFTMNQRYACLRCRETRPIIRIKMVASVVQSIGIFFLRLVKKSVVSVVFAPSRDFLVLEYVLKTFHIQGLNMTDLCDKKIEEDKIDSKL